MKVTRDMVDKDLRGRYAAGRIIAGFLHTRWLSLLVLRFSRAVLRGKNIRGLVCRAAYSEQKWWGAYSCESLSANRGSWTTAGHAVFAWRRLRSRGARAIRLKHQGLHRDRTMHHSRAGL